MLGNERGHHCIGQIVEVFGDAGRHLAVLCVAPGMIGDFALGSVCRYVFNANLVAIAVLEKVHCLGVACDGRATIGRTQRGRHWSTAQDTSRNSSSVAGAQARL
jgi:hypothetical protein